MGVVLPYYTWKFFVLYYSGAKISREIPRWIKHIFVVDEKLYLAVPAIFLKKVLRYMRFNSELQFTELLDIIGVDFPHRSERFNLVYSLLSFFLNIRVHVQVCLNEFTSVDSSTPLFNSAGWLEREIWDMYGIFFCDHQDLRRILTDYGFEGFPLRKDFPLTGFTEVRYDDERRGLVYEPLETAQEFRYFDFTSPWEFRS